MRIRGALAVSAVALLALTTAACGDDDDDGGDATTTAAASGGTTTGTAGGDAASATEDDYLAAIKSQFTSSDPDSLQLTDEQAECVAPKWLDAITVDRLKEKGITPADVVADGDNAKLATVGLSDDDAEEMYGAFGDCDVDLRDQLASSISTSLGATGEDADCIREALPDDLIERLFVVSVTKGQAGLDADQDLTNDLFSSLEECAPTTTT